MTENEKLIVAARAINILNSIDNQRIKIFYVEQHHPNPDAKSDWLGAFCGNVIFKTENNWEFTVFNDCDSFDYIDTIISPEGIELNFDWISKCMANNIRGHNDMLDECLPCCINCALTYWQPNNMNPWINAKSYSLTISDHHD